MDDAEFERLLDAVRQTLTLDQCQALGHFVRGELSRRVGEIVQREAAVAVKVQRRCPRCEHEHVICYGRDRRGGQRFKCVRTVYGGCGHTFNGLTGTALARLKKPDLWGRNVEEVVSRRPLARVAARLGVHITTAFRWRHRVLEAAAGLDPGRLSGVIEADETFFLRSFKGHRGFSLGRPPEPRAARRTGGGAATAGLSWEYVPVLTALDRGGGLIEIPLASRGAADIRAPLAGRIDPDSVLCSDGLKAYRSVAAAAGCEHRTIRPARTSSTPWLAAVAGRPAHRRGVFSLGRVNSRHTILKQALNGHYRGVSSRYLPNYLALLRLLRDPDIDPRLLLNIAAGRR